MGQITTGVGLVSGINIAEIVDQLMAIEQRPKQIIQKQSAVLTSQQAAFQAVNAQLLGLHSAANDLIAKRVFASTSSASSNESVLKVTSGTTAAPGSYQFTVKQLVASQRTITRGFQDTDATFVGPGALTFENGKAKLASDTSLDQLNGGAGIQRGSVRVTDRSGSTAIIDLSKVVTVGDVLNAFNNALGVNVVASVSGDSLVLTDNTGSTAQNLVVSDIGLTKTASSLGLAGNSASTDTLTGTQINRIGRQTQLNRLNDGNGVNISSTSAIRVTDGAATSFDVNLDGSRTLGDILDKINAASTAAGSQVKASVAADGVSLNLTDQAGPGAGLTVTALGTSTAAADLGILGSSLTGTIDGDRVLAGINSRLLKNLNGGQGVSGTVNPSGLSSATLLADLFAGAGLNTSSDAAAEFTLQGKDDQAYDIDLDDLSSVQDLIDRVRDVTDGGWSVDVEGNTLRFTDSTTGGFNTRILAGAGTAAADLGIAGYDSTESSVATADISPASYALSLGTIRITNKAGAQTDIDLIGSASVSDVLERINSAGAGVSATINRAGNGILITDESGGTGNLVIGDQSGLAAQALGIAGSHSGTTADSGSLQMRYVTKSSLLDELGISRGKFKITDSSGATATVDLTQGNEVTIGDVLSEINSRGLAINARINDTGDGIVIEDTGPGNVKMRIVDDGSTTAADLGILGEAADFGQSIAGSFEKRIIVSASDTLTKLVNKINEAGVGVLASIVNDGTPGAPYRLSLTGDKEGSGGAFVFDDGGLDLQAVNLSEAQDAVAFFGGNSAQSSLVITSRTNQLTDVIPGATIDLLATSDQPVQVSISRDDESIVESIRGFVQKFNGVIDTLNKYDAYNAETNERGLLLGDSAVVTVRNTLYSAVIRRNTELTGRYSSLSEVGIRIGTGSRMTFDEDKFRAAMRTDREAVQDVFTFKQVEEDENGDPVRVDGKEVVLASGIGHKLVQLLDRLSDSETGTIQNRVNTIDTQLKNNTDRIKQIDELLKQKRARLEAQFYAMEQAISGLQSQGQALASLSNLAASARASTR